jgi:DNA-binding HxlR family transcriptional regulator
MTEINKKKLLEEVVETGIKTYFTNPSYRYILAELSKDMKDGVSFTTLKRVTGANPSALNSYLKELIGSGMVDNEFKKTKNTREYSFYKITELGRIVNEYAGIVLDYLKERVTSQILQGSNFFNSKIHWGTKRNLLFENIKVPSVSPQFGPISGVDRYKRPEYIFESHINYFAQEIYR